MEDVLNLLVLITIGTVLALLIGQFTTQDPNAKGGVFERINSTFKWAIRNAFGG